MRCPRVLTAVCVLLLLLAACSSGSRATSTPSMTPVVTGTATATATGLPSRAAVSSAPVTTGSTAKKATTAPTGKSRPGVKPGPITDPLTGGTPSPNPVIAAKIDNTYFAIPQFGVADADVVFVEQVEGGLTRIIAVFHTTMPTEVGPVRSVRSTDAELLPAFGKPGLVFSGGAAGPLAALAKTDIVDTSALGSAYFRSDVASGTYNLHADLTKVQAQAQGLGEVRSIGFDFVAKSAEVSRGQAVSSIQVVMEQGATDFSYTGGRFVRMRDGQQVSDYQGRPEAADNVLVMNVTDTPDGTVDTNGAPSYLTQTVGSGTLTLYRDGRTVTGKWARASAGAAFTFRDSKNQPLPFKPGKTWVMLAPQTAQVSTA